MPPLNTTPSAPAGASTPLAPEVTTVGSTVPGASNGLENAGPVIAPANTLLRNLGSAKGGLGQSLGPSVA
jgi:hypothetical protein